MRLRCVICSRLYAPGDTQYTCPVCGDEGLLDVLYDLDEVGKSLTRARLAGNMDPTIRRWLPLLPVADASLLPPLAIGGTPLYQAPSLAALAGVREVRVKDDGRNPTASLKDRASAVCVARARAQGEPLVTGASTGNAASSLAGLAASVGLPVVIFVPAKAPQAKIAQLLIYGARVVSVDGTYDDACDLSLQATREFGWYSRNTGFNPYLLEGKKTAALEMAEQYGWDVPDTVLVSVGDGCIIGGVYKGFKDLHDLGLIERVPRLVAVQAEGSNAIASALRGGPARIESADTIADSISVSRPRAAGQAIKGIMASGGEAVTVSDAEILAAIPLLARHCGVFAEPAGATPLAGLLEMARSGRLGADERVALLVTGNGLKDVASAMKAVDAQPIPMRPDPEALRAWRADLEAVAVS